MGCLKIYKDNYADATVISNVFIDEYMKDANDAQLKIYLYLVRMMSACQPVSVSDIADKFNHTEKDVLRALKYWEKCRVLSLEFDTGKNLTGIHFHALDSVKEKNTVVVCADNSEAFTARQLADQAPAVSAGNVLSSQETVSAGQNAFSVPSYTLDDLKRFRSQENTPQLLFIAEQYLGRTLSPSDVRSILFFSDKLHFSEDLIDYLLQYCVERGKKDFRYIEKVAIAWAEAGVKTPEDAEARTSRYDKSVYSIMNALGKSDSPTKRELSYIQKWTEEFGYEPDVIFEACERTVLATDKHRFEYADKILSSWKASGVCHADDIAKADELFRQKKPVRTVKTRTSEYNQFMQNTYDFDALEKELLNT